MTTIIQPSALKACDVLLYHRTLWVSAMIRFFDGCKYSHSAIYDGSKVVEALGEGVITNSISQSIKNTKFVDVYRFRTPAGQELGDPGYEAKPIIDRIAHYVSQKDRFAYEAAILLAVLAATRRLPFDGWVPGLGKMLRTIFDSAADVLNDLTAAGKQPMICSELVDRCYCEAGKQYEIQVVGADLLRRFSLYDSVTRGVMPFAGAEQGNREMQELQRSAQEFLHRYAATARSVAIPDFVTPRDLATSPTFHYVGTLG